MATQDFIMTLFDAVDQELRVGDHDCIANQQGDISRGGYMLMQAHPTQLVQKATALA